MCSIPPSMCYSNKRTVTRLKALTHCISRTSLISPSAVFAVFYRQRTKTMKVLLLLIVAVLAVQCAAMPSRKLEALLLETQAAAAQVSGSSAGTEPALSNLVCV